MDAERERKSEGLCVCVRSRPKAQEEKAPGLALGKARPGTTPR